LIEGGRISHAPTFQYADLFFQKSIKILSHSFTLSGFVIGSSIIFPSLSCVCLYEKAEERKPFLSLSI